MGQYPKCLKNPEFAQSMFQESRKECVLGLGDRMLKYLSHYDREHFHYSTHGYGTHEVRRGEGW